MSDFEKRARAARLRAVWVAAAAQRSADLLRTREAWERCAGAWADLVLLAPNMKLAEDATLSWRAARHELITYSKED
jgi:hypothetical protein